MIELNQPIMGAISFFGKTIEYNVMTFSMTYCVMGLLVVLSWYGGRRLLSVPGKVQGMFEVVYGFLFDITTSTLGEKEGRHYFPFIMTLFLFVLISNWMGVLPNVLAFFGMIFAFFHNIFGGDVEIIFNGLTAIQLNVASDVWYSSLMNFSGFEEPTRSINTNFALAILVFFMVQGCGIRNKGLIGYLRGFADEPFPMKGGMIALFFLNPFFYLNIISALANVVSHAFRLFGNIFGGSMIILIGSVLLKYFFVPVGLNAFFGLFAGLVQAFVFTMLAVTYIQQQQ